MSKQLMDGFIIEHIILEGIVYQLFYPYETDVQTELHNLEEFYESLNMFELLFQ